MSSSRSSASKRKAAVVSSGEDRLRDFGYEFVNDKLVLAADNTQPFAFVDQAHYAKLCGFVTEVVEDKLVELGLEKLPLGDSGESIVFVSPALDKADSVVVLMHGSNNNAGLWSRKVIINESLDLGSMLAYVQACLHERLGVVIPNHSAPFVAGGVKVDNAFTYMEHLWDTVLAPLPAQKFAFVAHSFGGAATVHLLCAREAAALKRLVGLAFTDSVHNLTGARKCDQTKAFLKSSAACNWVRSTRPLDTPLRAKAGTRCVSAGHNVHENCSGAAFASVMTFLKQQFARRHVPLRSKKGDDSE
jgi:pimeloyl-ACP methyl ester carboxylesterase